MLPNLSHEQELKYRSSIQACKTRAVLTLDQAVEIFKIHLSNQSPYIAKNERISSSQVASVFGVSEKTIRDIWTGRTWFLELIYLDPARAAVAAKRLRPPGRPRLEQKLPAARSAVCSVDGAICASPAHGPGFQKEVWAPPASSLSLDKAHHPAESSALNSEPWWQRSWDKSQGPASGIPLHESCSQPSYKEKQAFEASTARGLHARVDSPLWVQDWSRCVAAAAAAAAAAEPLPASSRADDPFHDDWGRWPAGDAMGR